MDDFVPWRRRRYHPRVETVYDRAALEAKLRELCASGWEPISVLQIDGTLTLVLKHYCTRPDKDCIICASER